MPNPPDRLRDRMLTARENVRFRTAVLLGTIVTVVVAVLESDLAAASVNVEFGTAVLLGGGIVGVVLQAPRQQVAKAAALATGLPVLLIAWVTFFGLTLPGFVGDPAWALATIGFWALVSPLLVAFAASVGAIVAWGVSWGIDAALGSKQDGGTAAS